jgi:hypothetical protein
MCKWNKDGLQGSKLYTLGTWSWYIEYIMTVDGLICTFKWNQSTCSGLHLNLSTCKWTLQSMELYYQETTNGLHMDSTYTFKWMDQLLKDFTKTLITMDGLHNWQFWTLHSMVILLRQ